jgi:hypothetical protein
VRSSERVRRARPVDGMRRLAGGDIETEQHGPAREGGGREEVAQRAIRGVNARATLAAVGLDVRGGVGARGVETGVGPRGGSRQQELHSGGHEPQGSSGGRTSAHCEHGYVKLNPECQPAP